MARVRLTLYVEPGGAEVFLNIRAKDDGYKRVVAMVDTGAQVSLLSLDLLDEIEYSPSDEEKVSIQQAGFAQQEFEAVEAFVRVFLEDGSGGRTKEFEMSAWFAESEANLIGFADMLEQATLYIDMRQSRTGWIEIDD